VDVPSRDWRPIAAVVAVVLLALVVVGRLQSGNLADGDAGPSQRTRGAVGRDATPVASGLVVAGRVPLPGQAAAAAVGEGAVWVLLKQGTLLRVDPDRYHVTGRVELDAPTAGMPAGPLAVGAGTVWVGTQQATVTVRVDPVRLRVTARFGGHVAVVAHGMLWSYCCPRGDKAMGFARVDARTLRPRPPLLVKDAAGWRQPVGRLAVGSGAVWTQVPEDERVWRVPLAGGSARAVVRVSGFGYRLGADRSAVWVLSGTGDPGSERDRSGRLRRLDQRTGEVTATTPLPDLAVSLAVGPILGGGAVWLAGPYSRLLHGGGILLRVDPTSGRVTGWFREPLGFLQDVLAAGPRGAWVSTAGVRAPPCGAGIALGTTEFRTTLRRLAGRASCRATMRGSHGQAETAAAGGAGRKHTKIAAASHAADAPVQPVDLGPLLSRSACTVDRVNGTRSIRQ
jgi:outer membrane protein assembly factor BamB